MTFSEFIGIKCTNLDIETGAKMEHRAIYQRAVERFGGLEAIKPLIPFSLEQIKKALGNGDEYLNTLPIKEWDLASGFVTYKWECKPMFHAPMWSLYRKHGVTSASNAQGVCLLKEAARMWAEEEIMISLAEQIEAMQEIQQGGIKIKYRLKFKSYTDPNNQGYFVKKLKVGFKGCSLLYPDMARVMNKQTVDDVMRFMQEQGEMEYYKFEVEEELK